MPYANPSGANGPRMGQSHGRLRNTLMNIVSKKSVYPTQLVSRPSPSNMQPPPLPSPSSTASSSSSLPDIKAGLDRAKMAVTQVIPGAMSGLTLPQQGNVSGLGSNQGDLMQLLLKMLQGQQGQQPTGGPNNPTGGNGQQPPQDPGNGGLPPIPHGLDNVAKNQAFAKAFAASQYGWTGKDWQAIRFIVEGHGGTPAESNWLGSAHNPAGAWGIGQRYLPAHPWLNDKDKYQYLHNIEYQLKWMFDYIKERYGSPSAAWAYKVQHNNY